jgi:acetyl coenzyme A synthetase (ADP forming)-like protein
LSSPPAPETFSADVVLRDGSTVHLRPVRPDDGPNLVEFFGRLSPESRHSRFLDLPSPEAAGSAELARVTRGEEFALAAELSGRIVAIASYARKTASGGVAEAAFTVIDALQRRGIGMRMLECLADVAREEGVTGFEAYVLADNVGMLDVFLHSGFEVSQRLDRGLLRVSFSLDATRVFEERAAQRAREAATASMKAFFEPRRVAVVGASRRPGSIGHSVFANLLRTGFRGDVVPINLAGGEIDSVRAYPSIGEAPGEFDLAVVVVPAAQVLGVVDDCIQAGVRAIVVISAGFGESDAEGRGREAELVAKVRSAGIRLIGPNCMGILNTDPAVRLNATFSPVFPPEGRVGLSTQSGALGLAILDCARQLNIGISTFVSAGNKADVSGNDLLQYWEDDPRTDVILLYLESFGNPRNFARIARRVSRRKPIVAVKSGRSGAGARAASSHTGALAASDRVVDALFRQVGVIRTRTLEELFDVAALLAHQPLPQGRRVAILTNAGGPAILAADACESEGLELPVLSDATVVGLREFLPAAASVANPVDMIASASPEDYRRAAALLLADERVDSLLVIYIPPLVTEPESIAMAILAAAGTSNRKPVLATFLGAAGVPEVLRPIPSYKFPESAARALARVTSHAEWLRRPDGQSPEFRDFVVDEARTVVQEVLARGGGWLHPGEAERLLAAAGIPSARSEFAATADEARAAARRIGFPVAVKASGPKILHKSDVGGVALGLADQSAVVDACREMAGRLGNDLAGFLVQEMAGPGVELMVGAVDDPAFGPTIAFGSGGTLVELLGDISLRLHPLTQADVAEMMEEVKGTALLRGFRGSPPADEAAVRDLLLRLSALLEHCPEIRELDANPVRVFSKGLKVLDARVRVSAAPQHPPTRRIRY